MQSRTQAIVIGTSAGGIKALSQILPALPGNYPLPVVVVIHLPANEENVLPELFGAKCPMHVKEAEDKEPLKPGTIYFAPPNYHVLVEPNRRLSLSVDSPVLFCRPSIDILFETAAEVFGANLVAVVLTGANTDGAQGLRKVCDCGGIALIQRPETAHASMMPESALQACPDGYRLSLNEIVHFLQHINQPSPLTP